MYGESYGAAAVPFGLLVWSIPLNLLRDVPLMALMSAGQERIVFRVTVISALLAVAIGFVLVPRFGLAGAAAATLLAEVSRMLLAVGHAKAHGFPIPGVGRFGRVAVAATVMGLGLVLVDPASLLVGVPVGAGIYLMALVAAGGLRFVRGPGGGVQLRV
jgi:O-antigen/teichoic acid export membrane protein